jgi:hypothetical protein
MKHDESPEMVAGRAGWSTFPCRCWFGHEGPLPRDDGVPVTSGGRVSNIESTRVLKRILTDFLDAL